MYYDTHLTMREDEWRFSHGRFLEKRLKTFFFDLSISLDQ